MRFSRAFAAFAFVSCAVASFPAGAQDQQQQQARPTDVQVIGDWAVRCFPVRSAAPCDMFFRANDAKTQQLVLAVSIAYVPNGDRHAMQVVVPLGVAISKGLVIQTSNLTSAPLHYRRCDRGGCYVEQLVDNNSIDSIAKSDPDAKVKVVADDGRTFDLKLSLKGFAGAHDAMVGLAKQKAGNQGDAAAAKK